jgi:hypothetical protein
MYRVTAALLFIGFIGLSLSAQSVPPKDTLPFNPVGRYRVEIQSPPPRGGVVRSRRDPLCRWSLRGHVQQPRWTWNVPGGVRQGEW